MIAVAIPRCEAAVIDDGRDVSGAGETAGGGCTSRRSVALILPFLELLKGSARGAAESRPWGGRYDVAANRRRRLSR